jgi:hypothetical protein
MPSGPRGVAESGTDSSHEGLGSSMTQEESRLQEARKGTSNWKKWGPYLSERQWGTVREDYSEGGDAWNFFTHDHARSRAYRWGEDENWVPLLEVATTCACRKWMECNSFLECGSFQRTQ